MVVPAKPEPITAQRSLPNDMVFRLAPPTLALPGPRRHALRVRPLAMNGRQRNTAQPAPQTRRQPLYRWLSPRKVESERNVDKDRASRRARLLEGFAQL